MSYSYQCEDLLAYLERFAPAKVKVISHNTRVIEHGLVSVGLKIHDLDGGSRFEDIIDALGGREKILDTNQFRRTRKAVCWVLPPVGSARIAVYLLEAIEIAAGSPIFGDNRKIQIQVCSPKRLDSKRAALLSIGFYLGSDMLRRFTLSDLETTFSLNDMQPRGKRFILYDAGGTFDSGFAWWSSSGGRRSIESSIPEPHERTDMLTAASRKDIFNINLLATLLSHAQYDGYWKFVGQSFERDMEALLHEHLLTGLLDAPWVRTADRNSANDEEFFVALQELMTYALGEASRVTRMVRRFLKKEVKIIEFTRSDPGILHQMQLLLQKYRKIIVEMSIRLERGERA